MSDTTTATPAPASDVQPVPQPPKDTKPDVQRDAAGQELGEKGLSALRAERERGDRLEREMKSLRDQSDKLKSIFGGDDKVPNQDIVGDLQKQFATMQQANLVDRVARRHGITQDDDVEFLRTASDEATMTRLAQRLTATVAPVTPPAPNSPAPDPSQAAQPPTPEALTEAQYEAFYPKP